LTFSWFHGSAVKVIGLIGIWSGVVSLDRDFTKVENLFGSFGFKVRWIAPDSDPSLLDSCITLAYVSLSIIRQTIFEKDAM
jgi:hypothetical protein